MKLRNDFLESEILACELMLSEYKKQGLYKDKLIANKDQQIALLQDNVQNYKDLYTTEKDLKPDFWDKFLNTLVDIAIGAGLVATGYLMGSL